MTYDQMTSTCSTEVLVIGGGPSGAAAAYWLAKSGVDVLVVERKQFPREKTCGDGLTPRSVRQLEDMGLGDKLAGHHRFDGLRAHGFGKELWLRWPEHRELGRYGYVITRAELDQLVVSHAVEAGATLWEGAEAKAPLGAATANGGAAGGAVVVDHVRGTTTEVRARYTVVADGANSRIGRALGTARDRSFPLGMAIRGYFTSPRHDEHWIESHLDIRDRQGKFMPGYGWIFPLGDGRVNVGVGLLSTFHHWKQVNTTQLMEAFVAQTARSWEISAVSACGAPTGGRLPMGLSVLPHSGPDWVVTGDAAGAINPFNGEGIAYAYETGRIAAQVVAEALRDNEFGCARSLERYGAALEETYGLYYKVARTFVSLIGRPQVMRSLVATGMHSRTLMEWVLRIMANALRPDELGPAEAAYKAAAAIAGRTSR